MIAGRPGVGDPCPGCTEPLAGVDLLGHEIQGVYDGVLIWQHKCGAVWPRFAAGTYRGDKGQEIVDRWAAQNAGDVA